MINNKYTKYQVVLNKIVKFGEPIVFNDVQFLKVSRNDIIYFRDNAINKDYFVNINEMKNLKEFLDENVNLTDIYKDKLGKVLNYYINEDFIELNLNYERFYR